MTVFHQTNWQKLVQNFSQKSFSLWDSPGDLRWTVQSEKVTGRQETRLNSFKFQLKPDFFLWNGYSDEIYVGWLRTIVKSGCSSQKLTQILKVAVRAECRTVSSCSIRLEVDLFLLPHFILCSTCPSNNKSLGIEKTSGPSNWKTLFHAREISVFFYFFASAPPPKRPK